MSFSIWDETETQEADTRKSPRQRKADFWQAAGDDIRRVIERQLSAHGLRVNERVLDFHGKRIPIEEDRIADRHEAGMQFFHDCFDFYLERDQ